MKAHMQTGRNLHGVKPPMYVMKPVIFMEVTILGGAYRSQFETMNSYAALNKGSYRNAAKKVSGSSKCAPPYPACEKYTTSSSRSPGARGKTFTKKLTRNSRNVTKYCINN